jgi:ankyrin repeat protein
MRQINFAGVTAMLVAFLMTFALAQQGGQGQEEPREGGKGNVGRFAPGTGVNHQVWQAASDGDLSGVQAALGQGAAINFRGKRGFTPLAIAAKNGRLEVVKYLLDHGANIDQRDNDRLKTPLLAAAFSGYFEVVKCLVEHGANVNIQAINGWTPLHDAVYIGNVRISEYLVDHGTNLSLRNERHETPRQTAERAQYDAVRRHQTSATPADYKEIIEYIKAHEK